jgi:hypothetical protein
VGSASLGGFLIRLNPANPCPSLGELSRNPPLRGGLGEGLGELSRNPPLRGGLGEGVGELSRNPPLRGGLGEGCDFPSARIVV